MPSSEDMPPRGTLVTIVAALLFAIRDDSSDEAPKRAFDRAEAFVAETERRYGKLDT